MKKTFARIAAVLMASPLVLTAACGSSDLSASSKITIVGQDFTEGNIMTALYGDLLKDAGYKTQIKNFTARSVYIKPMEKNQVQISADYLSSMTDELNHEANGADAPEVATPDTAETLAVLTKLANKVGLTPLTPAPAQDANAYAVTKKFAQANHLTTLSDLGKLGQPIKLAAAPDCATRQDCKLGLKSVYNINITAVQPLGFDSPQGKSALAKGEVQLAQVATTDATLDAQGLVILTDDQKLQNAENLVPIVNSAWLKKNAKAAKALNKLSAVLTTTDLTAMIDKVDSQRDEVSAVASDYLKSKGLI
jgi:osmoprotectant transport system substrate-binding protein